MQNKLNILAICASPRQGSTDKLLEYIKRTILNMVQNANVEIVRLKDVNIRPCLGCTVCYDKGELSCPLKDDMQQLVQKMRRSDGVIFAGPTYVMNVSGLMKNFIDRLSYLCHRSEFFEKEAMLLTTCAGVIGSRQSLKSMGYAMRAWGFHISSELGLVTGHYTPQEVGKNNCIKISKSVSKFLRGIENKSFMNPGFVSLTGFKYRQICYRKAVRSGMSSYDLDFWRERGLLDNGTDYFFPVKTGILKKFAVSATTLLLMKALK